MVWADFFRAILGLCVLLSLAWLFSNNRKAINWRLVGAGIFLHISFALLLLKVPFVHSIFEVIAQFFVQLLSFTREGSTFLFGNLIGDTRSFGFIFAFQILPTILFFSAVTAALFYLGILQKIIKGIAYIMKKTMGLTGAESLAAAANIFIGQTEAPLLIKPYLNRMTKSELMCLMVGGMATVAGGVLAAYVSFLGGGDPEQEQIFATHLLTASIMNAPAGIIIAKMMFPADKAPNPEDYAEIPREKIGSNILDAISLGVFDGLRLAVNVGAMLLVFIAIIAMLNYIIKEGPGSWFGLNESIVQHTDGKYDGFTLQYILGMIFSPIAWLMGVPKSDIQLVGQLLGEKAILNELYAYKSLSEMKLSNILSHKSLIVSTFALCGFANFSSIGIQIGGISALAPELRPTLASLGMKALIGGTLACLLTGTIAGIIAV